MSHSHATSQVSSWVARWPHLLSSAGRVLDLACGAGRHARFFAARGHTVLAVDRDEAALSELARLPVVETRAVDLETEPASWPLGEERFAAIVVTNYLHRPLLPFLPQRLLPQGVLIYETFMQGNEVFGKPANPAFLLQPGELLQAFAELRVVAFEQGEAVLPKPAMVQRYCGIRGTTAFLDAPMPCA